MSVRPSVTRVLCDKTKQCTADIARKANHSSFLTPTVVGERRPFRLKFALISFEKRRLRQISAYTRSKAPRNTGNLLKFDIPPGNTRNLKFNWSFWKI